VEICAQNGEKDTTKNRIGEEIVNDIKIFSEKNNPFSKLLRNFLIFEKTKSVSTVKVQESNRNFDAFSSKIIRNVEIEVLDVFGASIANMDRQANSSLEKTGNLVHIRTKNFLIKNKLLFYRGEQLDPLKLSETERLIRQSKNIYDARVIAVPIDNNPDSVDIIVRVQDVWSITGSVAVDPLKLNGNLNLRDVNFMGLGNELSGKIHYNNAWTNGKTRYEGVYSIYNIQKTFISGNVFYRYLEPYKTYGITLNRDFFSPLTKWAGGVNLNWQDIDDPLVNVDSAYVGQNITFNQQDIWLGFATDFKRDRFIRNENHFLVSGRVLRNNYLNAPTADSLRFFFQDNCLFLFNFGYAYRRFYKDSFIFGFGRTEDIPIGRSLIFTTGYNKGNYVSLPYYGVKATQSSNIAKVGYISIGLEAGGYRRSDQWYNSVISGELLYFSPMIKLGNWYWRHFFWNRMILGYNNEEGLFVNVDKSQGVRGLSGGIFTRGTQKYVINYESNFFTPINVAGFRIALVLFTDIAFLSEQNQSVFKSRVFKAYGFGLRFKNDHLIFRTLQLSFAYYPDAGPDLRSFRFFEETRPFFQFNREQTNKPLPMGLQNPYF